MKAPPIVILISAVLIGTSKFALSTPQPAMESGLKYLQQAATPTPKPKSLLDPVPKIDRARLLKSAAESISKAPSIYKGRKIKAISFIEAATKELKSGHEAEAIEIIQQAIAQVSEGIELVNGTPKVKAPTKPRNQSADSDGAGSLFGTQKP